MIRVDGSSQCGVSLWLFSLDLYPLGKISIGGKRGLIFKLTRKHLLEKRQEFLGVHGGGECDILKFDGGDVVFHQIE